MPWLTYIEISTNNRVEATECGHDGILMREGVVQRFDEGDFIVRYPENLEGKRVERVFVKKEFSKLFLSIISDPRDQKAYWASLGWKV